MRKIMRLIELLRTVHYLRWTKSESSIKRLKRWLGSVGFRA